jgi:hypothetical protein
MPVPDFAVGEVLTSAAMDSIGLWLVYSSSFSGVTSFSLPDGTLTTNYRNYRITYSLTVNADSDFTMRMRKNGTDSSGGTYNTMLNGIGSNNVASNSAADSQTSWFVGEQDSGLDGYSAMLDLFQPMINARTRAIGGVNFINKIATASVARTGSWWHNVTDTFDSVSFISNQANSMTGVVRVYGYRD